MATQATLSSNHYDVLGLSPKASQDEIAAAFAAALNRLAAQPMVAKLHLYEAFGILRQPEKRNAYDRSIGLAAEPVQTTFKVPSRGAFSFAVDARKTDIEQPEIEQPEIVQPEFVKADEPRAPAVDATAESEAELHQLVERIRAHGHAEKAALRQTPRQPQDWRRLGIAAGVLIVGAGLFGGIAGVSASGPSTPEDALVEAPLPAPSAYLKGSAPSTGLDAEAAPEGENAAAQRVAALDKKVNRLVIPPEVEAAIQASAVAEPDPEPVAAASPAATVDDPLAPQPEPEAQTTAASQMPLPKTTIARTIQKIGYPCGAVASIAPLDAGGVFKVNCSSGHSYRAAPIGGRYRFKKWNGA